jgi:hypothetical protein
VDADTLGGVGSEEFQLGGLALHRGRPYIMRGYSRLSLGERQYVSLEDPETGERFSVPADEAHAVPLAPDEANPYGTGLNRER